jgi:hypothetical protein
VTQRTKDEIFMIKLFEEASKKPSMDEPFDRYHIGDLAGLQQRGVNAICMLLIRANFIKKSGETEIYITPHGEKLARSLLEDGK